MYQKRLKKLIKAEKTARQSKQMAIAYQTSHTHFYPDQAQTYIFLKRMLSQNIIHVYDIDL